MTGHGAFSFYSDCHRVTPFHTLEFYTFCLKEWPNEIILLGFLLLLLLMLLLLLFCFESESLPVAVVRHPDKSNLRKMELIWLPVPGYIFSVQGTWAAVTLKQLITFYPSQEEKAMN